MSGTRGTRSLGLLLMCFVFCVGLALAAATAGISAPATRTQPKLNPPTALWNAYPLRPARSAAQRASNSKPISTGRSKASTTSPIPARTGPTKARPAVVRRKRIASRPTYGTGGFPTVFVMTGLLGAMLASTLLLVAHLGPARAGGYRRSRGPIKTKPSFRTGRTGTPSPTRRKPSRATRPPSVEQPSRTKPSPPPQPKAVDENAAAPSPPDERETTDDLLEALRPNIEPVEDPAQVSARESGLRPVKPAKADPQLLYAVRQTRPQRREVAADQFCEIKLWRGYVKCQFYVEVERSPGAFVKSSFFRLRNPLVPDDRARRALADLLVDLERSGWSVVETGPDWYRRRLRRSTQTR